MALASVPAVHEQRSLRRMRQFFSRALAPSPRLCSFGYARLAAFCDAGLRLLTPETDTNRHGHQRIDADPDELRKPGQRQHQTTWPDMACQEVRGSTSLSSTFYQVKHML